MRKNGYDYAIVDVAVSPDRLIDEVKAAPKIATLAEVKRVVTKRYALKPGDLESSSRVRPLAIPRQTALYLCRVCTKASFPQIGRHFGDRHHTTVMFAFRKLSHYRMRDAIWDDEIKTLIDLVQAEVDAREPPPRWSPGAEIVTLVTG